MLNKLSQLAKTLVLLACFAPLAKGQGNSLLNAKFWTEKPSLQTIKDEVAKGNDPTEANLALFDPTTFAINAGASADAIEYLLSFEGNSVGKLTHHFRSYLHWAAAQGNMDVVRLLLDKGSDIYLQDEHGTDPLFYALQRGTKNHRELVDLFASRGYDLKRKNSKGETLIMQIAGTDRGLKLTDHLLTLGLSLADRDLSGATVADHAARHNSLEQLQAVLARGVQLTPKALLIAAEGTRRGATSLEMYRYLIETKGIDPKIKDADDNSLLHLIATKPNQAEVTRYLVEHGVDPQQGNSEGNTALLLAARGRDTQLLQYLLGLSPDVQRSNLRGETALTQAVAHGTLQGIQILIEAGAKVQVKDVNGYDLGYHLVMNYREIPAGRADASQETVGQFLDKLNALQAAGYDLKAKQRDGSTLLHHAASRAHLRLLDPLVSSGIDINAQDEQGMTALHRAALTAKDVKCLQRLIMLGADKQLKTELDETAYELALDNALLTKTKLDLSFLK